MMRSLPIWQRGFLVNLFAMKLKPELRELYQFSLIFSFASALITIFEPIFFYKLGIPLSVIAMYYALHYTLYVLVLPLGAMFTARFGMEKSLSFSLPVFVLYFLSLAAMPTLPQLFWIAMGLLTIFKIFYWPAYDAYFAKLSDLNNRGTELSWMALVKFGVGILGPLIGGFIATTFGFPVLFLLTAVTVLLSAVPLLRTREYFRMVLLDYWAPWRIIFAKKHIRMVLAMMGMGEGLVDLVFWPIFIFIVLGTAEKVGLYTAITVAVMSLLTFVIGELSDRFSRRTILRIHLPFMVLGYLLRPFSITNLRVLFVDSFARMTFAGVNLPLNYILFTQSKAAGYIKYATAFEMALAISKALTAWFLVFVFAAVAPYVGFTVAFWLAAMLAPFYFFL